MDSPPVPPGQLWLLMRDGQSQIALLSLRYIPLPCSSQGKSTGITALLAHKKQGLPLLPERCINEPIKSRGARTIGTHSRLEPLRILIGVGVVVELDVVVAFKAIAGNNQFMHEVMRVIPLVVGSTCEHAPVP